MTPLDLGATIGILGGGQLGRMMATAAARLGFDVHVYAPEPDSPAARVAARASVGPYEDEARVAAFAATCDVVTYEFENVPAKAAAAAGRASVLRPSSEALAAAQDRVAEKAFAVACGAQVARWVAVDTADELAAGLARVGLPAVLKTRRHGYDGKGQAWIRAPEDAAPAWARIGGRPAVLEAGVAFEREVSQIAARGADGALAHYDLTENVHAGGVLAESRAPAAVSAVVAAQARAIAERMLVALDYVGVLAVELFHTGDDGLLVNEIAPRVHNSGHWTLDAAACDQFEQHIRAVAGWPLGATTRSADVVMRNALGPDGLSQARAAVADAHAHVHLYGKRDPAPGRKLGHVTWVGSCPGEAPSRTGAGGDSEAS